MRKRGGEERGQPASILKRKRQPANLKEPDDTSSNNKEKQAGNRMKRARSKKRSNREGKEESETKGSEKDKRSEHMRKQPMRRRHDETATERGNHWYVEGGSMAERAGILQTLL